MGDSQEFWQRRPIRDVHVTPKMINRTLEVWGPIAGRELSREEAHEIIVDMTVFFRYLLRWDTASRRSSKRSAKRLQRETEEQAA